MSYRDDHDAALLRIDALEQELGESAGAQARLAALEGQLANAHGERDRMRARLRRTAVWTGVAALLLAGGVGMASRNNHASMPPVVSEPALVVPPPVYSELATCVAALDGVVATHGTSGPDCVEAIRLQAEDPTLGSDVHAVLAQWLASESTAAFGKRDALASRIKAVVRPEFIR